MNATKIPSRFAPEALTEALSEAHSAKRCVRLKLVADDYTETAYNTRWDGGSRDYYYTFYFGVPTVSPRLELSEFNEGDKFGVPSGVARVTFSYFCGKECDPCIVVRYADALKFFGIEVPDAEKELPVEVVADWMDENAEFQNRRVAKHWREVAAILRKLTGVAAV